MKLFLVGQIVETFARPNAYLDPGSGSILLQLVIAGLLGAGIFLRASWSKIVKLFKHNGSVEAPENDEE
jgi:hypothetical protein